MCFVDPLNYSYAGAQVQPGMKNKELKISIIWESAQQAEGLRIREAE